MYIEYNPNTCGIETGDCTVRAIAKLMNKDWDEIYVGLCVEGFKMCSMPSTNSVWSQYLIDNGYEMYAINPITVEEFCITHPNGKYLLATGSHAVTIVDGNHYDLWNSAKEPIIYYFTKEV